MRLLNKIQNIMLPTISIVYIAFIYDKKIKQQVVVMDAICTANRIDLILDEIEIHFYFNTSKLCFTQELHFNFKKIRIRPRAQNND